MHELTDFISEEEKLLNEWQERLGLQDWAIALRYNCEQDELELQEVAGETHWNVILKTAIIYIVSEEVYGSRMLNFDFEKTLVHELLHLKFSIVDIEDGTYESKVLDSTLHQLIDDLARALVMAKRKETKRHLDTDKIINRGVKNEK